MLLRYCLEVPEELKEGPVFGALLSYYRNVVLANAGVYSIVLHGKRDTHLLYAWRCRRSLERCSASCASSRRARFLSA